MIRNLFFVLFFVSIQQIKSLRASALYASIEPKSQWVNLKEGQSYTLTCRADGYSAVSAAIFKGQEKVGQSSGLSSTFTISYARAEDSGSYDCLAYSTEGNFHLNSVSVEVELNKAKAKNTHSTRYTMEGIERFVGQNLILSCFELLEDFDDINWSKVGGSLSDKTYRSLRGQLKIDYVTVVDGGEYICQSSRGEKRFRVFVTYKDTPKVPTEDCQVHQATCRNGQCISRSLLCDGRNDCADGSDEIACAFNSANDLLGKCDPTESLCQDYTCKQKFWFCDGEYDCDDTSDELNCPAKRPFDLCNSWEFECRSGDQCVHKGFLCDGTVDCTDGSDEIGCREPVIVQGPVRIIDVCVGDPIVINCTANGFPKPYINWRLNWGHTCQEPRCVVTNDNGYGVFTITNSYLSDAGAYSCEAINSKGRIFAVDAIVTVRPGPCRPCFCHGHSNTCDESGRCLNCEHNTEGTQCERCVDDYLGDARRGTPFDCVLSPPNCDPIGTRQIFRKGSGKPICVCHPGYTGVRCELCDQPGYRNLETGRCVQCFCNGLLEATCRPSNYTYKAEVVPFSQTKHGWTVVNRHLNYTSSHVHTENATDQFIFTGFEKEHQDKWFFRVKIDNTLKQYKNKDGTINKTYNNNLLTSFYGNLSFELFYEADPIDTLANLNELELRISGVNIALKYKHSIKVYPHETEYIKIQLKPDNFVTFPDDRTVSRDHFLMVLSSVDTIMISASYMPNQILTSIRAFSYDIADNCDNGQFKVAATEAELCTCPQGYVGTSCESCDYPAFKRHNTGVYLGDCVIDCEWLCNGNSNKCSAKEYCEDCQNNTTGAECNTCLPGFRKLESDPTNILYPRTFVCVP